MKIEVLEGYDPILDFKYYIDMISNETGEVLKQYSGYIPKSYASKYNEFSTLDKMFSNISRRRDINKWMDDNLLKIARMEIPDIKDIINMNRPTFTIYVKPINDKGE